MNKFTAVLFAIVFLIAIFAHVPALPSRDFDDQEFDFFRAAEAEATPGPSNCVQRKPCASHAECAGNGKAPGPRCVGALVGNCDCGACVGGVPCKDDSKCGGLQGACINKTKTCNCLQAAQMHYDESGAAGKAQFPTLGAAINAFCTQQGCQNSSVPGGCLGLPCKKGTCICQ